MGKKRMDGLVWGDLSEGHRVVGGMVGAALEVTRIHTDTHVLIIHSPFQLWAGSGGGGDLARHLQISGENSAWGLFCTLHYVERKV
jgi:hypothetical protein